MDKISLRRKNLRTAIDAAIKTGRFKFDTDFCAYYDLNPSHISQLINGHGSFGERAARRLEKKVGWEDGLLDKEVINTDTQDKKTDKNNALFETNTLRKIPVLDFVQAGSWREVVYDGINPMGWTYTSYQGINPDEIFSVTVSGLSMSPRFNPNDELVVDPNLSPQPGDFVVACNNDYDVTFKKYRVTGYDENGREQFQLVPLNQDFATLDSKLNNIRIIGIVVSHIQNFR